MLCCTFGPKYKALASFSWGLSGDFGSSILLSVQTCPRGLGWAPASHHVNLFKATESLMFTVSCWQECKKKQRGQRGKERYCKGQESTHSL